ncbi:MAG: PaaX family transcriptional regulator C-terminal domain-containing protein [Pseudomonadota bacterium]
MSEHNTESGNDLVAELVDQLHNSGKLRVWSIIVTIFGDCIIPRGGVISLSSLQEVLGLLGVENNAVRTAMSRLAADGWIKREKVGRQSYCSLTNRGRELAASASERIYASSSEEWDGSFEVILRDEQSHKTRAAFRREMRQSGFGSPIADIYIRPKHADASRIETDDVLATMDARNLVSGSMREFVCLSWPLAELNVAYSFLLEKYEPLLDWVNNGTVLSREHCLTIRTLLIHDWRKLVLQDVDLPAEYKPDDWVGDEARHMVAHLYGAILSGSEQYLDDCMATPQEHLPAPETDLSKRFGPV